MAAVGKFGTRRCLSKVNGRSPVVKPGIATNPTRGQLLSAAGEHDDVGVVGAIGGDDVEGGTGEFVGAITVPMRPRCLILVRRPTTPTSSRSAAANSYLR
jgi:hypothetical protein